MKKVVEEPKKRKSFLGRLFKWIVILLIIAAIYSSFIIRDGKKYYEETTKKVPLSSKITEIKNEYTFVGINEVPRYYIDAIVAVEDKRFYDHGAVDYIGILRAIKRNITNKKMLEGASTIEQQVIKNLYFINDEFTLKRKVAETYAAIDLEEHFKDNKDGILELYINIIYFGDGYYGVKEACNGYLKKDPSEMTYVEAAMLAGLPNAPSAYSPTVNKEYCKSRTNKVLKHMLEYGCITQEQFDNADLSFIDEINK